MACQQGKPAKKLRSRTTEVRYVKAMTPSSLARRNLNALASEDLRLASLEVRDGDLDSARPHIRQALVMLAYLLDESERKSFLSSITPA